MPIEHGKNGRHLLWVKNPFTGTVTYFTEVRRKRSGFPGATRARRLGRGVADAARRQCPFCPGNESSTVDEVLRIRPQEVSGPGSGPQPWLIRAFHNLVPRLPEACTAGRNESYVVVEDPRHFVDGAVDEDDLVCSADLPLAQMQAIVRADLAVAREAYRNPAVRAVLIRKNQGRESGASQPHVHSQVIGCDRPLPSVGLERETLDREPELWQRILDFVAREGFVVEERDGCLLYFCPFGVFPRSYEIVCPGVFARITEVGGATLEAFVALLHRALGILGSLPLDYEIHDGPLVPLHAHINARYFPYSNIGGTLNLPAGVPRDYWSRPAARGRRRGSS